MPIIRSLAGMIRYGGFMPSKALFTAGLRRMTIGTILQHSLVAGIKLPGTTEALGIFRRYGLGIRTSDFGEKYGRVKRRYENVEAWKAAGRVDVPPEGLIGQLARDEGKKFTYTFGRETVDPITGEKKTEYRS
ncbi:unnamed protein product, partial [marine sediment metagenome]